MARPLWFVKIIQHFFPDRFAVARWTKQSALLRAVFDHFLFKGDQIFYLTKDSVAARAALAKNSEHAAAGGSQHLPFRQSITAEAHYNSPRENQGHDTLLAVAEKIELLPSYSLPSMVLHEFIEEASHIWLMERCLCRDSAHCKDYPVGIGCIFMGEAVLKIDPRLGHLATKEEAYARLEQAKEHGLVHLVGRNKIDTQWMGVQPVNKLLTVCQCCACCCLYKVLPDLHSSIRQKIEKMPGLEVWIDTERCVGCERCLDPSICMTGNIRMKDGKAVMDEYCVGCGRCTEVCFTEAIHLEITDDSYVQETIRRIKEKVDVR